jgi:hypothetical protein
MFQPAMITYVFDTRQMQQHMHMCIYLISFVQVEIQVLICAYKQVWWHAQGVQRQPTAAMAEEVDIIHGNTDS